MFSISYTVRKSNIRVGEFTHIIPFQLQRTLINKEEKKLNFGNI